MGVPFLKAHKVRNQKRKDQSKLQRSLNITQGEILKCWNIKGKDQVTLSHKHVLPNWRLYLRRKSPLLISSYKLYLLKLSKVPAVTSVHLVFEMLRSALTENNLLNGMVIKSKLHDFMLKDFEDAVPAESSICNWLLACAKFPAFTWTPKAMTCFAESWKKIYATLLSYVILHFLYAVWMSSLSSWKLLADKEKAKVSFRTKSKAYRDACRDWPHVWPRSIHSRQHFSNLKGDCSQKILHLATTSANSANFSRLRQCTICTSAISPILEQTADMTVKRNNAIKPKYEISQLVLYLKQRFK